MKMTRRRRKSNIANPDKRTGPTTNLMRESGMPLSRQRAYMRGLRRARQQDRANPRKMTRMHGNTNGAAMHTGIMAKPR